MWCVPSLLILPGLILFFIQEPPSSHLQNACSPPSPSLHAPWCKLGWMGWDGIQPPQLPHELPQMCHTAHLHHSELAQEQICRLKKKLGLCFVILVYDPSSLKNNQERIDSTSRMQPQSACINGNFPCFTEFRFRFSFSYTYYNNNFVFLRSNTEREQDVLL